MHEIFYERGYIGVVNSSKRDTHGRKDIASSLAHPAYKHTTKRRCFKSATYKPWKLNGTIIILNQTRPIIKFASEK